MLNSRVLERFRNYTAGLAVKLGWEVDDETLFDALVMIGASKTAHTDDRQLLDHLKGTYEILRSWDLPRVVQVAGLFHSVYSTPVFRTAMLSANTDRQRLQSLISPEAEHLVWLFSKLSFNTVCEVLFSVDSKEENVSVMVGDESITLLVPQLLQLCYIHCANMADQSIGDGGRPGYWVARVARALLSIDRIEPLEIPILRDLAEVVTPQMEVKCRRSYDQALALMRVDQRRACELFMAAAEMEFNFEPLIYAAVLSLANRESTRVDELCRQAERRLSAVGILWDHRRSKREWLGMIADVRMRHIPNEFEPLSAQTHTEPAVTKTVIDERNRFNLYLESFSRGVVNRRSAGFYPGIRQMRFHDKEQFEVVRALEANYCEIRKEIQALSGDDFHAEGEPIARVGSWDVLMFYERGRRMDANCEKCPTIASILKSPECMRTLSGLIYVSRLGPDTRVSSHFGPTNLRVRCHLGIEIPGDRCGLEVGGRRTTWGQGECIVFDDSFEHCVWNLSDQDRIVLIVDLWNPELSDSEITMLTGLQEYCGVVGPGLVRYWNMNETNRTKKRTGYD